MQAITEPFCATSSSTTRRGRAGRSITRPRAGSSSTRCRLASSVACRATDRTVSAEAPPHDPSRWDSEPRASAKRSSPEAPPQPDEPDARAFRREPRGSRTPARPRRVRLQRGGQRGVRQLELRHRASARSKAGSAGPRPCPQVVERLNSPGARSRTPRPGCGRRPSRSRTSDAGSIEVPAGERPERLEGLTRRTSVGSQALVLDRALELEQRAFAGGPPRVVTRAGARDVARGSASRRRGRAARAARCTAASETMRSPWGVAMAARCRARAA